MGLDGVGGGAGGVGRKGEMRLVVGSRGGVGICVGKCDGVPFLELGCGYLTAMCWILIA